MAAAAPAKLAGQVRGLPPVPAPEQLRSLIAAGRAFTVGPSRSRCAGNHWRATVVARLGRLSAATVTRCGAPLDALVDGLLADLVDVGAADDNAIVAVWRSSRG